MKSFKEHLNEQKHDWKKAPTDNLRAIFQLASKAEDAWNVGNKDAYEMWINAIWNSNDSIAMGKFITKAQKEEENFSSKK